MSEFKNQTIESYFKNTRITIVENLTKGSNHILDVGCGVGEFGKFLKKNGYASHVTGIEINRKAADEASKNIDQVYCADLNIVTISEIFNMSEAENFEYITCNDVLEHLIDPWQTLSDLVEKLAIDGKIIASIPNVRHWTVWLPLLLKGQWNYQDAGIMDKTHLRFFTKKTMMQLFESANLNVVEIRPLIGGRWKLVDKYSLHLLRDFVAVQWVLIGSHNNNNDKK